MEHVFSGIFKVWAKILTSVMSIFTSDFWKNFQIYEIKDLSIQSWFSEISSKSGSNTNGWTLFNTNENLILTKYLPGLATCMHVFVLLGIFVCVLMLLIGLVRAMLPQDIDQDIEHPVRVITRFGISFCAVFWSYKLLQLFTMPLARIFSALYGYGNSRDNFRMGLREEGEEAPSLFDLGEEDPTVAVGRTIQHLDSDATIIGNADLSDLGTFALVLILMTMMSLAYLRLVLELVERWLTLVFLIYVSPLAMSTLSAGSLKPVFKNYVRMVFSEYLLIMFNYIFVFIFCAAYVTALTGDGNSDEPLFANLTQAAVFFAAMTAWCRLGQRLDEHMNTLGISAARTGAGLGGELWGAAMTTAGTALAAGRAIKSATRTGKSLGSAGQAKWEKHKENEAAKQKKEADYNVQNKPNDLGVAKKDTFQGMLKGGDLSATGSATAMSALAAAGGKTDGLTDVAIGQKIGANGEPVGAMRVTTNAGNSFDAYESSRQMSSQSSIANVGQNVGGTYMAMPVTEHGMGDSYIKDLAASGGFKGYDAIDSKITMPTGAELIQDKNGEAFLAMNTGLYNVDNGIAVDANSSANSWRMVSVDRSAGNYQQAAAEMAKGMRKNTVAES